MGAMFLPPAVMISSFLRSVMRTKPSASISPTSPRVEPPLGVEGLPRGLFVLVVALEDVGASHEKLAVVRELHLASRGGRGRSVPSGTRTGAEMVAGPVQLAHPPDVHDRDAEAQEELVGLHGHGRGGGHGEAGRVDPQLLAHLREDESVGEGVRPGPGPALLVGVAPGEADLPRPGRDLLLERAVLGPGGLDSGLDLLPDPGHARGRGAGAPRGGCRPASRRSPRSSTQAPVAIEM